MDGQTLPTCAKRLALELPFTEHCWPFGPEYDVFKVGGKIFMLVTELRGRPLINLKSDPQKSLLNQQIYPSIEPGYHMNKKHWNTIMVDGRLSAKQLMEMIDDSYTLVASKTKK